MLTARKSATRRRAALLGRGWSHVRRMVASSGDELVVVLGRGRRPLRTEHPDFVVLDVMMPERDGLDVLRSLKASEETRHIPVVLLTAKATDADIWHGWRCGTDYYLTKPFNIEELLYFVNLVRDEHATAHPVVGSNAVAALPVPTPEFRPALA